MKKRTIISVISLVLLLFSISFAYSEAILPEEAPSPAPQFTDLSEDHWAKDSIDRLAELGLISGYPDGTVRPDGSITRAEFVKLINSMMRYSEGVETSKFKDIKTSDWFYGELLIAEKQGYISGFPDGTFRPEDRITKEQVCAILCRVVGLIELPGAPVPKDPVSDWAKEYVTKVLSNRIMRLDDDGNFFGDTPATRAVVADAISNFVSGDFPGVNIDGFESGKITQEQVNEAVGAIVSGLEFARDYIEQVQSAAQKDAINDTISALNRYLSDNSMDIASELNEIRTKHARRLTPEQKENLKVYGLADVEIRYINIIIKYFDGKISF